jgi:hypothetical protein
MFAKIIPDDLTGFHHEPNPFQFADVGNWITGNGNEVGKFSRLNRSDAVLPAQHFRGVGRNGSNHVKGGIPALCKVGNLDTDACPRVFPG